MRRSLYVSLMLLILVTLGISIGLRNAVSQLSDFIAYTGLTIPDGSIDDSIGPEWDDASSYTGVAVDPSGTAEVWTKNDGTYLYIALRFTADSSDPWLAFQLSTTGCMDSTADVAIFGHNTLAADGYSDAYFPTGSSVDADTGAGGTQDGVGAMGVGAGNVVTIELKKPLNSGDSAGNDIVWSAGNTYSLVIAWDSDGGGSSGGGTKHRSGTTPTARTILISSSPPPTNPITTISVVYHGVKYEMAYDETKLRIEKIGWFAYDVDGNLDAFGVKVVNVDAVTHSGTLCVSVGTQLFDYDTGSLAAGGEALFLVDLNPNLPTASTITVDLTVITTT